MEPTSDSVIGYEGRYNFSPIDPESVFGHAVVWRQQITEGSEYRLKYAKDHEHRLGARWVTETSKGSKWSIGGSLATTVFGCDIHHTTALTDKLSIKVKRLAF